MSAQERGDIRVLEFGENGAHGARSAAPDRGAVGKLEAEPYEREWSELEAMLEGREGEQQLELVGAHEPRPAQWRRVDVSRVRVERLRQFGRVYLGLAVWRRLGLHKLLSRLMPEGREDVGWEQVACTLTLGRFCAQKSELSVAQRWYNDTALEDLLGVPFEKINETRLYRGLDEILWSKDALCAHMMETVSGLVRSDLRIFAL